MTAPAAPGRSHRTAVAIVPPDDRRGPIQAIRRRHDRQIGRWPPHVNLLYPFVAPDRVDDVLDRLRAAAARVAPFALTLAEPGSFAHRGGRATIWLRPEPVAAVRALQAALQAAFPAHDDLARFPAGYTPHLSVGQTRRAAARDALVAELRATWRPLAWTVVDVVVLRRGAATPFTVAARCPLATPRR